MAKQLSNPEDILQKSFGGLTPIAYLGAEPEQAGSKRFLYFYECQCACGGSIRVARRQLLQNQTTKCDGPAHRRSKDKNPNWKGHQEVTGSFWAQVRWKAHKRGLPLTVTMEDAWNLFLVQNRQCALSGVVLVLLDRSGNTTASLDRIDSSKGYVHGNVQWVHKDINHIKSDLPDKHFIEWCKLVAHHRKDA